MLDLSFEGFHLRPLRRQHRRRRARLPHRCHLRIRRHSHTPQRLAADELLTLCVQCRRAGDSVARFELHVHRTISGKTGNRRSVNGQFASVLGDNRQIALNLTHNLAHNFRSVRKINLVGINACAKNRRNSHRKI